MNSAVDLTAVRKSLGMSRAALAEEAGVDVSTISRWENKGVPERGSARALINRLAAEAKTKDASGSVAAEPTVEMEHAA